MAADEVPEPHRAVVAGAGELGAVGRERVLGVDHPDTLIACNNIAAWTGGDRGRVWRAYALCRYAVVVYQS